MASTTARDWLDPTRLYNPKAPAGRLMYIWGVWIYPFLWTLAIMFVVVGVEGMMGFYDESPILDIVLVPMELAALVAGVLIVLRRLRDLEMSGWSLLLFLVPVVNLLFGLYLFLAPGRGRKLATFPASPPNNPAKPVVPIFERKLTSSTVPTSSTTEAERPARPSTCPRCGSSLDLGARYCIVCGAEIT
jgi:uncharacterized membrane protein YhaH (DUF805 family)